MDSFTALLRIQEDIQVIKPELRQLRKDIESLFKQRNKAKDGLYLIINQINREPKTSLAKIKQLAVRGLKASKDLSL